MSEGTKAALNDFTGISTATLEERLAVLCRRWDEDDFEGGGSPRESVDEQIWALESEIKRRVISKPNAKDY